MVSFERHLFSDCKYSTGRWHPNVGGPQVEVKAKPKIWWQTWNLNLCLSIKNTAKGNIIWNAAEPRLPFKILHQVVSIKIDVIEVWKVRDASGIPQITGMKDRPFTQTYLNYLLTIQIQGHEESVPKYLDAASKKAMLLYRMSITPRLNL